ncbi:MULTISPECIES: hypothetical protein [Agrobacterium]|uniref:Uncharacterized protein n=2 Tax=Agrobacterium tumefaciens TaxID=358 RepID=A0AB36ECQ3_AGRTU|nr:MULTISPECIES: hypothetical protein [Agrobacterium]MDZ7926722.1 hypothetical protein [Agrobacterium sp.]ADY66132.1 hypothetical protein AGROH133_10213 [Agrobacterium tumefaciens]KAA3502259.1 hypothetical protein DXM26_17975 [Agrobacterium tumefaciens]MDP9758986.1 hypothetical protein [Agrobacterium tumefaciens]MDQ1220235.1 hypothetical protein [Agrobacterium sp. SORGH_AS_0745]
MESAIVPVGYHMVRQSAVIIMNGEKGLQPIHVTQEALNDIQSPPQCDAQRLAQFVEVFATIAASKIEKGMFAFDGQIWITATDVRAWLKLAADNRPAN